jgi:general secretion pathway protein A
MYEAYFGLKERPFSISPDPRFMFLTAQHQEALAKCQSVIENKMGASAIHGDIGSGKTSLARRLMEIYAFPHGSEKESTYNFALIVHPIYPSAFQLLKEIMREFGLVQPRRSLADYLDDFQRFLQVGHDRGKTNILVIDEAQNLKSVHLELVRQFLNFESSTEKFLQIVLFGQNELALKLDRTPALKDRTSMFGALTSLTREDARNLIEFRFHVAGGKKHPFTEEALDAIFKHSQGLPRRICKICDNALIRAYSANRKTVGPEIIETVAEELRLREPSPPPKRKAGGKKSKKEDG